MRPRHESNVSSSTPAAIRFWVALAWLMAVESDAAALDFGGLVIAASPDVVEPVAGAGAGAPPLVIDELVSEDTVFPSLAHPPTRSPKNDSQIIVLSMEHLP